jgi:hypothetical protein
VTSIPLPLTDPTHRSHALRIIDDYGPVGVGGARAHSVLAENAQEYLVKGPTLNPDHRYGAANEFIAANLADTLGLPVLDYRLLQAGQDFYFGSSLMVNGTYVPVAADLLQRCSNRERVYDLVAFDTWLCNIDRHEENLLVRTSARGPGQITPTLLLNDHDRCLVLPGETPAGLMEKLAWDFTMQLVRLPFVRDAIAEARFLRTAIDKVESITDAMVDGVVASLPEALLPRAERASVVAFLKERRDTLRELIRAHRSFFRNLDGGAL